MNDHLPYWLAASYLPEIGPRKFLELLKNFPSIAEMFNASCAELLAKNIPSPYHEHFQNPNWKLVETDLAWLKNSEHHLIAYDDADYPALLKEIADPPLILYVLGNQKLLSNLQIAIVGSRSATAVGLKNAERFGYALADAGLVVTSGLALGIDGASHRGALSANGNTIGVSGTGLKHIYPASHRGLVEKIVAHDGAVITEFPLTMPPLAANFPRRNRIISGLSVGVLVIEAALKSGSLITARYAADQGREVFAIPGSIQNSLTQGCHHLIKQGAKLVEKVDDILMELGTFSSFFKAETKEEKEELDGNLRAMLEKIEYEITSLDVIILRSRLTMSEVSSILLALELKGYIQSVPGGYIRVG